MIEIKKSMKHYINKKIKIYFVKKFILEKKRNFE